MIDLEEQFNFTNKLDHPTNSRKTVYRFLKSDQAEYFTELLVDADIEFEAQIDKEHAKKPTYFGVAKKHEKRADHLNNLALGRGRDKFIASPEARWVLIVLSAGILLLAVTGAIVSNLSK